MNFVLSSRQDADKNMLSQPCTNLPYSRPKRTRLPRAALCELPEGQKLTFLGCCFLSCDCGLERRSSLELGHRGRCNLEFSASLGVSAFSGGTLGGTEGSESDQGYSVTLGHGFGDRSNNSVESVTCCCFGNIGFFGCGINEFRFVQGLSPLVSKWEPLAEPSLLAGKHCGWRILTLSEVIANPIFQDSDKFL